MEIKKKPEEFEAVSKVVPHVKLKDVILCHCSVKRMLEDEEYKSLSLKLSSSGELLNEVTDGFQGKVSLCLTINPENNSEIEIIRIEADYIVHYNLDRQKTIESNDLNSFCSINSVFNVWPYWREFVHNMSYRISFHIPAVPLIKISP